MPLSTERSKMMRQEKDDYEVEVLLTVGELKMLIWAAERVTVGDMMNMPLRRTPDLHSAYLECKATLDRTVV
jgi:hypothetical protein